jgi:serine/threonine protein kinase
MASQLLNDRYQLQDRISSKAGRQTYRATDLSTQNTVIVKLLIFESEFKWESLRLFEREIEVLKSLDYPTIPKYLDSFDIETTDGKGFGLVQTHIEAKSLEAHLSQGRVFSEKEVLQIAESLLETLSHIHSRNPSVIHRDIKPSNVLLGDSRNPSVIHRDIKPSNVLLGDRSGDYVGDVFLVDFGAVQTIDMSGRHTMTVVGTYGYMPPEQFGGRSSPASDLYSLGATLLYLITGSDPAELINNDLELEFGDVSHVSQRLENWLRKILRPIPSQRFSSADEALDALFEEESEVVRSDIVPRSSSDSQIERPWNNSQVSPVGNFEIKFSPQQVFIRKTDRVTQKTGFLEKILSISAIFILAFTIPIFIPGISSYVASFQTLFLVSIILGWSSVSIISVSLFLIMLGNLRPINGAEIFLMKSDIHETAFILKSRGKRKDRKVLTRNITCVEVIRTLDIWMGRIYYKIVGLKDIDAMQLAESIADWLNVPLHEGFFEE